MLKKTGKRVVALTLVLVLVGLMLPEMQSRQVYAASTSTQVGFVYHPEYSMKPTYNTTANIGRPLVSFPDDPAPHKKMNGLTFAGWFTELDGKGQPFTKESIVEGPTTLYAYWDWDGVSQTSKHTVGFVYSGSSVTNPEYQRLVVHGEPIGKLPEPGVRDGYSFDGWYLVNTSTKYTAETPVNEDIMLTIRWTANSTGANNNGDPGTGAGNSTDDSRGTENSGQTDQSQTDISSGKEETVTQKGGLSEREIRSRWNQLTLGGEVVFDEKPSTSPHSLGQVSQQSLQDGLDYLNFVRALAGLPAVKLDSRLNEASQYGAVILAELGYLDHYPQKPAGMSESFYQKAYEATSKSNLSMGPRNLPAIIQLLMEDSSGEDNLLRVGHRRWLLYSKLGKVGFGYYDRYGAVWVMDDSASASFDYIAWPAAGNFPTDVFATNVPWSVTPDWNQFKYDKVSDISVTVTRQSDNQSWIMNSKVSSSSPNVKKGYFNVDQSSNQSYVADWDTIIFHMGADNLKENVYAGEYEVMVSGLKKKDGTAVTLRYTVDFFTIEEQAYAPGPGTDMQTETGTGQTGQSGQDGSVTGEFADVPQSSWYANSVTFATERGLFSGLTANTFGPEDKMTRAMFVTVLGRLAESLGYDTTLGINAAFDDVYTHDWYYQYVRWAARHGIVEGYNAWTFAPNDPITREQIASLFIRFCQFAEIELEENKRSEGFVDTSFISRWAYDDVWKAVEGELMQGSNGRFHPQGYATRAEVATVFMNLCKRYLER